MVDDWSRAIDALRAAVGPALYVSEGRRPLPVGRVFPTGPMGLFRAWADGHGRFVAGPDVGVTLTTTAEPEHSPVDRDIDIVFTWVDGTDPAWLDRRSRRDARGLHPSAANAARFVQMDELRYALRAVERFAPWRRTVFLVTDGQRPSWLTAEFPHVVLVPHDEIFDDPQALPTFNSHAIAPRLHHIPGLAEHWIYFNDDVFLGRYTPPSTFFTDAGLPLVFPADDGRR